MLPAVGCILLNWHQSLGCWSLAHGRQFHFLLLCKWQVRPVALGGTQWHQRKWGHFKWHSLRLGHDIHRPMAKALRSPLQVQIETQGHMRILPAIRTRGQLTGNKWECLQHLGTLWGPQRPTEKEVPQVGLWLCVQGPEVPYLLITSFETEHKVFAFQNLSFFSNKIGKRKCYLFILLRLTLVIK